MPTISLQIDDLGAGPLEAWIQGEADVLRTTCNMLCDRGRVSADGRPTFSGEWRLQAGPVMGDGRAADPLGLK